MNPLPSRGEIWLANLEPVAGHEQGGLRPCLVLSDDTFNYGPAELVVVLPLTSKQHSIRLRIPVEPPDGGLKVPSYIMPEMIRSISIGRLRTRWGRISEEALGTVESHVRVLLRL